MSSETPPKGPRPDLTETIREAESPQSRSVSLIVIATILVFGALYFAREFFIPVAAQWQGTPEPGPQSRSSARAGFRWHILVSRGGPALWSSRSSSERWVVAAT